MKKAGALSIVAVIMVVGAIPFLGNAVESPRELRLAVTKALKDGEPEKVDALLKEFYVRMAEQNNSTPEQVEEKFDTSVKAAGVRKISAALESIRTATMVFRSKYNGLPGDIKDMDSYFGSERYPNVQNGNGNQLIDSYSEQVQFWQHLLAAELIQPALVACPGLSEDCAAMDAAFAFIPFVHFKNFKELVIYRAQQEAGLPVQKGGYLAVDVFEGRNHFLLGVQNNNGKIEPKAALTPNEAYTLDAKLDEGKPKIGAIQALDTQTACIVEKAGENAFSAEYAIENSQVSCALRIRL